MAIDDQAVRDHAREHLDALLSGNVERAVEDISPQLRSNLGEIIAMLPLPLTSAEIESVDGAGTGYKVVVHLVGETTETRLEMRWKDRDGRPTIVEVSHLSEGAIAAEAGGGEGETTGSGDAT